MAKKKSILFMYIRLKILTKMSIEIDTCLSFISEVVIFCKHISLPKIFKCKFTCIILLL